jgi:hypothetical protein
MYNKETILEVEGLVKPSYYHLRIQVDFCSLHFSLTCRPREVG